MAYLRALEPVTIHPSALGSGLPTTHIKSMSHKGTSPRIPDLFEYTITVPTPLSEPASAFARPPELDSFSDAQLVQHLGQLVDEFRQRLGTGRGSRPELEAAAKQASLSLRHLVPSPTQQDRPSRSSKTEPRRDCRRLQLLRGWSHDEENTTRIHLRSANGRSGWFSIIGTSTPRSMRRSCRLRRRSAARRETLRNWVRQAERDQGLRAGPTSAEQERIKALEREVRELRQANEILRKASAYFAQAELDRRFKP